jgi:hypothetical protein
MKSLCCRGEKRHISPTVTLSPTTLGGREQGHPPLAYFVLPPPSFIAQVFRTGEKNPRITILSPTFLYKILYLLLSVFVSTYSPVFKKK